LQGRGACARAPGARDLFLCHAWDDDREGSASELYDRLKSNGATVWFSERDVALGKQLLREIDKGLRNSRVGIVLTTPARLESIAAEGIAQKELSVLLARRRVIPLAHGTTFEALRGVSPMLASHSGLDTAESSLEEVAAKVAARRRARRGRRLRRGDSDRAPVGSRWWQPFSRVLGDAH
jgi:hypothetical protein